MKYNYVKHLISFALAALLGSTVFVACAVDNSGPGNANQPSIVSQEELGPAIDVQNRHTDALMAIDGVNGTGVGVNEEGTPVILVFTMKENVKGIPASLEGFSTQAEFIGEVKAYAGFKGTYRSPMWSGVSVGNANECASGTIGCVVKRNVEGTDHFYLLSNNHVFARENAASINEVIGQPGRYDNSCAVAGAVANLSQFVPILFGGSNNTVDAAIAEIANGITYTSRMAINSYTPSATTANAAVNMTVKKTGRTTGLTSARVSGLNVTINVQYTGGVARFIGQVMVKGGKFSQAGDSGSLIVESSTNKPVALLFAGGSGATFGNPISAVLNAFGVTVVPN